MTPTANQSKHGHSQLVVTNPFWKRVFQRLRLIRNFLKYYRLQKMMMGWYHMHAVFATTQLGLVEYLHSGAKRCEDLAAEMDMDANRLSYLLGLLTKCGIVTVNKARQYTLTSLGERLSPKTPNSLYGTILSTAELLGPAWGNLAYSLRTGKAGFDEATKMPLYEHLHHHVGVNANFNRSMEESTREWILPTLDLWDLSTVRTVVDIGGGTGMLTAAILNAYPHVSAILFDQDAMINEAPQVLETAGVAERCRIVEGDFFESVPEGGDLYIISRVLLNWDDRHALEILTTCRAAMSPSARLLLIDFVFPKKRINTFSFVSTLNLLALGGRLMRTEQEYNNLLRQAGFASPHVIRTGGPLSFIETVPV